MTVQRNQAVMRAVSITFMVTGVLCVALRIWVRTRVSNGFGWDDWLIVIALLCYMVQASCVLVGVHWGLGSHIEMLTVQERVTAFEMTIMWELGYICSTTFLKSSVGASLLRLTKIRRWTHILWTGMVIDFMLGVCVFCYVLFTCSPVEYQWTAFDPTTPPGHCQPTNRLLVIGYVFLAVTCAVYFLFATLPIFMLWNVQIPSRVKISVMCVLSLGLVAMVANMVRLKYLSGALRTPDTLYNITDDLIWSLIECGSGMITACVATYRPLLRMCKGRDSNKEGVDGSYKRHVDLEDIFQTQHGIKTTVQANHRRNNASEEDMLGTDIIQMVEITVEETREAEKAKSESFVSDAATETDGHRSGLSEEDLKNTRATEHENYSRSPQKPNPTYRL